jgi:hypothetical protein
MLTILAQAIRRALPAVNDTKSGLVGGDDGPACAVA